MEDTPLADLFEPVDRARWLGLVEGVLKGADFEKRLVSHTADGLRIEPLYGPAAPAAQPVREPGPWRIAQRVDHPDLAAANAQALIDLEGGADALVLAFAGAAGARGYGLTAASVEDLDAALKGVMLPLIALRIDAGGRGLEVARLVSALAQRRGEDLSTYDLDLGIDPVGVLAATGSLGAVWKDIAPVSPRPSRSWKRRVSPAEPSWPTDGPITRAAPERRRNSGLCSPPPSPTCAPWRMPVTTSPPPVTASRCF